MMHYVVELLLWVMFVFFAGSVIGYFLRALTGGREVQIETTETEALPEPAVAEPSAALSPEPLRVAVAETTHMKRPKGLAKARGGKSDRLQMITGIGPKNEKLLHHQGVFHYDQIAQWTPQQVAWLDDHLKFRGRIAREQWVRQASLLAEGRDDEFRKEFGSAKRG